jgi:Na+-driven multidrug efflux pump
MLARNEHEYVLPNLKRIIKLSFLFTFCMVIVFTLFPESVISIVNSNESIMQESVFTLRLISISMLLFGICGPMLSFVSGAGDTQMSFLIEFTTIVLYLSGAYILTIVYPQPVHLVWSLEYLYFGTLFLLSYWYILKGKWRTIII